MPNPVKTAADAARKDIGEALVKPTIDEAGRWAQTAGQAVFGSGPTPDPQKEAQRKADEEYRKQNILRYFEALKANAASHSQQKQTEQQKKQEETADQQKIQRFEIQKKQKQQQAVEVFRAQRKAEIKVKGG